MTGMAMDPPERTHWPVSVTLRRAMRERRGWTFPAWSLAAVELDTAERGVVETRVEEGVRDFRWSGLRLSLHRSNAETYWYNLTSRQPSLLVICQEDPQYGLMPWLVTLDQDESARQQESEAEIFSTPLPAWLIDEVERFVMSHYRPEPRRRKRRKPREASDE
ncbi:DUF3305 domain-containing protein [Spiribacter sp. 2438]|uniref:DUF3305 domain-containing protein n=1 Tax=Spiribacter sp. 2438 TaxID=2666185 RepID=UPI0012B0BA0E|nr:DUF3305 domain-containing protein [Spiribacter sp. 2438]QGM20861.1 DUF3305 domain-containing protein [Spiribacter sp. 2438]